MEKRWGLHELRTWRRRSGEEISWWAKMGKVIFTFGSENRGSSRSEKRTDSTLKRGKHDLRFLLKRACVDTLERVIYREEQQSQEAERYRERETVV